MSTQLKVMSTCIVLGTLLALLFLSFYYGSDNFYIRAYEPMVEKSQKQRAIRGKQEGNGQASDIPQESRQPRATGLKEAEIYKERGERYSTF